MLDDATLAVRKMLVSTWGLFTAVLHDGAGLAGAFGRLVQALVTEHVAHAEWAGARIPHVRGKTPWERYMPVRLMANFPELLTRLAAAPLG